MVDRNRDRSLVLEGVRKEKARWINALVSERLIKRPQKGAVVSVEDVVKKLAWRVASTAELEREAILKIVEKHVMKCSSRCAEEIYRGILYRMEGK